MRGKEGESNKVAGVNTFEKEGESINHPSDIRMINEII